MENISEGSVTHWSEIRGQVGFSRIQTERRR